MLPPALPAAGGRPSIDGRIVTVEQVCEFAANRFQWDYEQTMRTPAGIVWALWRSAIDQAEEQTRKGR